MIATPGRRKTRRLVHVNLIKEYHPKDEVPTLVIENVTSKGYDDFCISGKEVKIQNSDVLKNPSTKLSHLSLTQAEDVNELLMQFKEIFGDVPKACTAASHNVQLVEGARPVKQPFYRLSHEKLRILKQEVDFLLDNNLAEPSDSPWASPCILVAKKDGGHRMCTDFERLIP
ncbi:uncharacterized protein [Macrobrachium rosenbergii]|uniref:uncharacterized protein n=1 Tax=Macrobrachium rosenbergii TaxID=79674 RepID=UPI0034D5023D